MEISCLKENEIKLGMWKEFFMTHCTASSRARPPGLLPFPLPFTVSPGEEEVRQRGGYTLVPHQWVN